MPAIAGGRSTGAIELEVAPFDTKVVPHTLEVVSFDVTVAPSPSTLLPLAFVPSRVPPRLTRSIWKKESGRFRARRTGRGCRGSSMIRCEIAVGNGDTVAWRRDWIRHAGTSVFGVPVRIAALALVLSFLTPARGDAARYLEEDPIASRDCALRSLDAGIGLEEPGSSRPNMSPQEDTVVAAQRSVDSCDTGSTWR